MKGQEVVILGDFDNFFHPIMRDESIFNPRNRIGDIGRIIAIELIRLAKTFGEVHPKNLIGAFALPSARPDDAEAKRVSRAHFRKQALEFVDGLNEEGFIITLVQEGYNESDSELERRVVKDIRKQSFVSTVIIVTGDGKDPFRSMISALHEKGKKVHVAVYDTVPHAVKRGLVPCEYSRLAPIIHQRAHEIFEASDKTSITPTTIKSSAKSPTRLYLNALYAIKNNGQFAGEAFYLERAQAGLEALADTRAHEKLLRSPVGKIIAYLGEYLKKEKKMNLEWSEVEPLAYALIRFDRFSKEWAYTLLG